jgi:hypothetical protein
MLGTVLVGLVKIELNLAITASRRLEAFRRDPQRCHVARDQHLVGERRIHNRVSSEVKKA